MILPLFYHFTTSSCYNLHSLFIQYLSSTRIIYAGYNRYEVFLLGGKRPIVQFSLKISLYFNIFLGERLFVNSYI